VQIEYELYVGDAMVMKELPFVVGVLGDFSGKPEEALPPVTERTFTEIDRDTFDDVLAGMKPRLAFRVDNKLEDDGTQLSVDIRFNSIKDFDPDNLVENIAPLSKLVEARKNLSDLLAKMDGNDRLEKLLNQIVASDDARKDVSDSLGIEAPGAGDEAKEDSDVH
jgi:type VI secretion system protein ImpB